MTCGWDGNWAATDTLMPCVYTHCIDPPTADPVNVTQLEPVWDGNLVDFGQIMEYKCMRGMKFSDDINLVKQEATCNPGNNWVTPVTSGGSWKQCVETKYCSLPPEAPPGGSVKIISDGYMYGRVCSTGGQYITLDGVGECHSQTTPAEYKQEEHVENATHIYSRCVSILIIWFIYKKNFITCLYHDCL